MSYYQEIKVGRNPSKKIDNATDRNCRQSNSIGLKKEEEVDLI